MIVKDNKKPIIWLIDEHPSELKTHSTTLRRIMPPSVEVKTLNAYKNLVDYLPILEEPATACIITDQRLKRTGIATYTGIELAEFLRRLNSKVPIYILTNFADEDDFTKGEWTVEDIIRKSELVNKEEQRILAARILRRINVYEDIRNAQGERLNLLLLKSMNGELEDGDLQELDTLRLTKISPGLAKELEQVRQMTQIVKAQKELMSEFERLVSKTTKDDNNVL